MVSDVAPVSRMKAELMLSKFGQVLFGAVIMAMPVAAFAQDERSASVVVLKSTAEPYVDTLLLRGRTEATRRVDVRAEEPGLVVSEPLLKGDIVKKGQVLCRIADGDRRAELTEAEARLKEAEIEEAAAKRLAERGFGAETTANTKTAALQAAKARIIRAEMGIVRLEMKAPFDGILETDTAELGSLLQNGSICASVITLDPIKMVAFAPERSVDALKVGATVEGRLITGRRIEGEITYVARSAERNTRTYLVEAETENSELTIRDGMTTEMRILLEGKPAHELPQTALTLDNDGNLGVRLNVENRVKFMPVTVLRDQERGVWVAGLPDEIEVIIVGQEFVTDGQLLDVSYAPAEMTQ